MEHIATNVLTLHEVKEPGTYLLYMNGSYQGLTIVCRITSIHVTCVGGYSYDKSKYTVPDLRFIGPLPEKIFT